MEIRNFAAAKGDVHVNHVRLIRFDSKKLPGGTRFRYPQHRKMKGLLTNKQLIEGLGYV